MATPRRVVNSSLYRIFYVCCHAEAQGTKEYQYIPLDASKKEIRILSIDPVLPATSSEGASKVSPRTQHSIHTSLDHVSLEEAGKYTALSYTWGDPTPTHNMSINGTNFGITENLHEALIHLRRAKVKSVWIDAVCINQKDKDERGLQVQWMGEIYQKAENVISWIGIQEDGSAALFKWIETSRRHGTIINEETMVPPMYDQALTDMAKRPYFSRMWVLQEFAIPQNLLIMCGDAFVDPEPITELFYHHASTGKTDSFAPAASLVMLKQVRDMQQAGIQLGLVDLLMYINSVYDRSDRSFVHNFKSSNFMDQIYGVLGLVYDSHQFVPAPNYELTMNNLFEYMTRSIIQNSRRLDYILCEASDRTLNFEVFGAKDSEGYAPAELPSWCPDYVNLHESPLNAEVASAVDFSSQPSAGMHLFRYRYGERRLYWHATRLSELTDTNLWKDDSKQLHVSGMLIGTVLAYSAANEGLNPAVLELTELDNNSTLLGLVQLLYTYSSLPLPSPSDAIIALFLALHQNLGPRSFRDINRMAFQRRLKESQISDELASLFRQAVKREYVEKLTTMSSEEEQRMCELSCNLTESTNKNYEDFRRRAGAFAPNTSIKTVVDVVERCGPFAWIPQTAKPGDEIWLLRGCSMPIVLRRVLRHSNSNLKFFAKVGPAVVNGAMDGDMWSENDLSSIVIE